MTRRFAILFALAAAACAQSLVEPERVRQEFERSGTPTLRCEIAPVKPAPTYAFRFEAGYKLTFPLSQFGGAGHRLQVHVRVTPEGQQPVYFSSTKALPDV